MKKSPLIYSYFILHCLALLLLESDGLRVVKSHRHDAETTIVVHSFCMLQIKENGRLFDSQNNSHSLESFQFSEDFLKCKEHTLVESDCYLKLPNGSVEVPLYGTAFHDRNYLINDDGDLIICEREIPSFCWPPSEENATETAKREKRSYSSNDSLNDSQEDSMFSKLSEEFLECKEHIPVDLGCYIELSDGSIKVPLYDKIFDDRNYRIDSDGSLIICSDFFEDFSDDSKFSQILDIFSTVGVAMSAFCLTVYITMFLFLKNLRNLPGYCLFSLCKALLLAYTCTFISRVVQNKKDCTVLGIIMLFAFLASFFWMNTVSFDVWRSLRIATAKLRVLRDQPMFTRFGLYCLHAWGGPLLIIFIALIVDSLNTDYRYHLRINNNTCWFHYRQALLVYFGIPFLILLILNVVLFVHSFIMITSASMNTSENKAVLWSRLLISIRLATVMGLTWVTGIISSASDITVFWYIYTIMNTLQGVFIFLCFAFTDKTIKECKRFVLKKKSSIFPSQTSTTRGQSSSTQQDTPI